MEDFSGCPENIFTGNRLVCGFSRQTALLPLYVDLPKSNEDLIIGQGSAGFKQPKYEFIVHQASVGSHVPIAGGGIHLPG